MSKRISKSKRATNLIKQGYSNKYIFENFPQLPKQIVYNARWRVNKEKGIASLPKAEPVASGTGITSSVIPLEFEIIDRPDAKKTVKASNNRRKAQLARYAREREERAKKQMQDQMNSIPRATLGMYYELQTPQQPTLWQKIKSFFVGS